MLFPQDKGGKRLWQLFNLNGFLPLDLHGEFFQPRHYSLMFLYSGVITYFKPLRVRNFSKASSHLESGKISEIRGDNFTLS